MRFEDKNYGDNMNKKDLEKRRQKIMRSMTDVGWRELKRDKISTFLMRGENTECFDNIAIYTVEVPVREHRRPEVIEA